MRCQYRYCNKEITFGRPRKYCNDSCRFKELSIVDNLKRLERINLKTRKFIKQANNIHKNKYDYSKTLYESNKKNIIIICEKHGEFNQTPNNHIYQKSGCPKCVLEKNRLTKISDDMILEFNKIHNNKYEYRDLNINNSYINIYCKEHGTFSQYLYSHKKGYGCKKCFNYKLLKLFNCK